MKQKNNFTARDHTFVICAYKESKYLKNCIRSLENQTVKSHILIATSTGNAYIRGLAEQYHISLYENDAPSGIATDWNFAYRQAHTKLVTIAHQDDIPHPNDRDRRRRNILFHVFLVVNGSNNSFLIVNNRFLYTGFPSRIS